MSRQKDGGQPKQSKKPTRSVPVRQSGPQQAVSSSSIAIPTASFASQVAMLKQLDRPQQQIMMVRIGRMQGNSHVQRLVSTLNGHSPQNGSRISVISGPRVQRTLQDEMSGQWNSALVELNNKLLGTGGVIGRQMRAVQDFTDESAIPDPPTIGEQILISGINMLLGAALGGIGTVLKGFASRFVTPTLLRGATRATMGTAVDSADVRGRVRVSMDAIIDKMVDAGKSKVSSAVQSAWEGGAATEANTRLQFRQAQMRALEIIGQQQAATMNRELAALAATSGTEDEWEAANALYDALQQSLDQAYEQQFNKMTDTWFTMQARTIGMGARPGVLQIELERRYPNSGAFQVAGSNLVGSGSVESIRRHLRERPLEEIGIPKVVRMNGKMGWGIADCQWSLQVTGHETSSEPAFRAPSTGLAALAGPQHITQVNGHPRWGLPWLAAYQLGLEDLEHDDARNTSSNQWAGAEAVWNAIKAMRPGTVEASTW